MPTKYDKDIKAKAIRLADWTTARPRLSAREI
jgi:hypothetical protein